MAFDVRVRVETGQIVTLSVATSAEEFKKTTIKDLKKKVLHFMPQYNYDVLRMMFGGRQLEDDRTLEDYNIEHLTIVQITLRLRGGATPEDQDDRFPRSDSMERLFLKM